MFLPQNIKNQINFLNIMSSLCNIIRFILLIFKFIFYNFYIVPIENLKKLNLFTNIDLINKFMSTMDIDNL